MLIQFLSQKKVSRPSAFFFLITFFFASCHKNDSPVKTALYNGEELFRGLLFGEGRVAEIIPEIKNLKDFIGYNSLKKKDQQAVKFLQDNIIKKLKEEDPNFLKTFQARIQSGNQLTISSALKDGKGKISAILYKGNSRLAQVLNPDNEKYRLLVSRVKSSKQFKKLEFYKDELSLIDDTLALDPKKFTGLVNPLYKELGLDKDVLTNTATHLDVNVELFNYLGTNLNTHFDRHAFKNQQCIVDVDVAVVTATVAAIAIVVVAFIALVVVIPLIAGDVFNDTGAIFQEQLINSIAKNVK